MSGQRRLAVASVQKGSKGGKKGKGDMSKLDSALKAAQPKKKR